jgi:hypothetical protein
MKLSRLCECSDEFPMASRSPARAGWSDLSDSGSHRIAQPRVVLLRALRGCDRCSDHGADSRASGRDIWHHLTNN